MSKCPAGKLLFPIVTIWQSYKHREQELIMESIGQTIDGATINTNIFIFRFPIKSSLSMWRIWNTVLHCNYMNIWLKPLRNQWQLIALIKCKPTAEMDTSWGDFGDSFITNTVLWNWTYWLKNTGGRGEGSGEERAKIYQKAKGSKASIFISWVNVSLPTIVTKNLFWLHIRKQITIRIL